MKANCSSQTQIVMMVKIIKIIQQAVSITTPQSDKYYQHHEAR